MKITIRIENHQPVPLEPLASLRWREGDLVYIGSPVMLPGLEYRDIEPLFGWMLMGSPDKTAYPFALETGETFSYFHHYDFDKTLGRLIRPGERLIFSCEV